MNNELFNSGLFTAPGGPLYYEGTQTPNQQVAPQSNVPPSYDINYIEGILKAVGPVKVSVYMTFTGSKDWPDKKFTGILEAAGRDHIMISEPTNGHWILLPNVYIDYIEFEENIKNIYTK